MKLLLYGILISIYLQGVQFNVFIKDDCCTALQKTEINEKDCKSKCCKTSNVENSSKQCHKSKDGNHKNCDDHGMCKCTVCHHFITNTNEIIVFPTLYPKPISQNEIVSYLHLLEKEIHYTIFQPPKFI